MTEKTKRQISPATRWRRELQAFEEEALGETSVDDDWVANEGEAYEVSHALSRRQLAENRHDRRPQEEEPPPIPGCCSPRSVFPQSPLSWCALPGCRPDQL